ncbi:hypothetical protein MIB92_19345 [Aestuariirhabdus sp. Z084]|uniref:hypothetical protein n=1 Tax=Aestuariirhabdus haliotis TaxID=2918751 RepID=UPI00201B3B26|nr:hypothetical protein [Aestuariirhabdus haliotis]MCL6417813.1 hypothetical protein [Aestuariirhabdus haliotis]MCL6421734.1 hypothetical protein [Aestuariirhabdus haliotis]
MAEDIDVLKSKLMKRQPNVSGAIIVEIFGGAAYESWAGALALIEAYLELEEMTGEPPNKAHINDELYLVLKSYWSADLGDDLIKLDSFLGKVRG